MSRDEKDAIWLKSFFGLLLSPMGGEGSALLQWLFLSLTFTGCKTKLFRLS